jgi:MFS family permease
LGGWATDHLAKAGHKDGILRVAMFGGALCYPFAVAVPFAENSAMAVILLTLACSAFGLFQGLPAATFLSVTPNRLRARVLALYFLIGNLVAFTIGPTVAALISDHWLKDPTKIGVAVGILCAVAIPLGVAALAAARRPFTLLVVAAESVEN